MIVPFYMFHPPDLLLVYLALFRKYESENLEMRKILGDKH
jgi:hypothetical protein